jgi:hypothetical protein
MAKNDGGPAHPVYTGNPEHWQNGMALRDWFAGQALPTVAAYDSNPDVFEAEWIASRAYSIADAMLAERDK